MNTLKLILFLVASLSFFAGDAMAQSSSTHTSIVNPGRTNNQYSFDIAAGTTNPNITKVVNANGTELTQTSNPTGADEYRVDITTNADGSHSVDITFGKAQPKDKAVTVTTERDGGNTPAISGEEWSKKASNAGPPSPF